MALTAGNGEDEEATSSLKLLKAKPTFISKLLKAFE